MRCCLCPHPIREGDEVEYHHPVYKSRGGQEVKPAHKACHRAHHAPDFPEWGRQGGKIAALTRRWSLNLRNVATHPAYEFDRQYYRALYAPKGAAYV